MKTAIDKSAYRNGFFIIKIGDRFFRNFGKNGRVLTSWHVADAKRFVINNGLNETYYETTRKLGEKGKEFQTYKMEIDYILTGTGLREVEEEQKTTV